MGIYRNENGNLIEINYGTSGGSGGGGTSEPSLPVYSTEETKIGIWLDNKPIFQKVLEVESVAKVTGYQVIDLTTIQGFTDLINHSVVANFTASGYFYTVNAPYYSSSSDHLYCYKRDNYLFLNSGRSYENLKIVIQYTKNE